MHTAVDWSTLTRGFRLALTIQGLRPHTVTNYVRDVERFARSVDGTSPSQVTEADIHFYLGEFQQGRSPKTLRDAQLALRRFFRFLAHEGEIPDDPASELQLAHYKADPQPAYSEGEIKRLVLVCDPKTPDGLRNRALVLTLFDTGVRVGELVSMSLPDWERRRVTVTGKTGVRHVPLGVAALQATERYVRRWRIAEGTLWRGKRGMLTTSGVLQIVRRLCRSAGVEDKGVHAFRRAAAAQMKRLGMQDSDILEVLGWKDVTMLRRYTATVAEELAHKAHRAYSPADRLQGTIG